MTIKHTHSTTQIIPAILSSVKSEFTERLSFAQKVGAVHIDVIDAEFVNGDTLPIDSWPEKIEVNYAEVHLMVKRPSEYLERLASKGVSRAIIHIESEFDLINLRNKARELDILLGFAVNPDTDLIELKPILDTSAYVQIMGVNPGSSNQTMIDQTSLGVSYIRKTSSRQVVITVDGGVSQDNIQELKAAGADHFIASHAIFAYGNPQENYDRLTILASQGEKNDD